MVSKPVISSSISRSVSLISALAVGCGGKHEPPAPPAAPAAAAPTASASGGAAPAGAAPAGAAPAGAAPPDADAVGAAAAGAAGGAGGSCLPPQPTASALISETDREIELEITGFETIPKIYAKEGYDDLPEVQPRAHADRVLERRQHRVVLACRPRQVVALVVGGAADECGVARIEEAQPAD